MINGDWKTYYSLYGVYRSYKLVSGARYVCSIKDCGNTYLGIIFHRYKDDKIIIKDNDLDVLKFFCIVKAIECGWEIGEK